MATVNEYFVFKVKPPQSSSTPIGSSTSLDMWDQTDMMSEDDLRKFIVPGNYVKQESKIQK